MLCGNKDRFFDFHFLRISFPYVCNVRGYCNERPAADN